MYYLTKYLHFYHSVTITRIIRVQFIRTAAKRSYCVGIILAWVPTYCSIIIDLNEIEFRFKNNNSSVQDA